jgi:hypothetical protein
MSFHRTYLRHLASYSVLSHIKKAENYVIFEKKSKKCQICQVLCTVMYSNKDWDVVDKHNISTHCHVTVPEHQVMWYVGIGNAHWYWCWCMTHCFALNRS